MSQKTSRKTKLGVEETKQDGVCEKNEAEEKPRKNVNKFLEFFVREKVNKKSKKKK